MTEKDWWEYIKKCAELRRKITEDFKNIENFTPEIRNLILD